VMLVGLFASLKTSVLLQIPISLAETLDGLLPATPLYLSQAGSNLRWSALDGRARKEHTGTAVIAGTVLHYWLSIQLACTILSAQFAATNIAGIAQCKSGE